MRRLFPYLNKEIVLLILTGIILGFFGVYLGFQGANSNNMGFCSACFLGDNMNIESQEQTLTEGELSFTPPNDNARFKKENTLADLARPEIMALVLGATVISLLLKEHKGTSGTAIFTRFLLGYFMMTAAQVFIGCSFRLVLRMGAGDLNAYIGFLGFLLGCYIATLFIKKGFFSLGRKHEGYAQTNVLFPFLFAVPLFYVFLTKIEQVNLFATAVVFLFGVMMYVSKFCETASIRNLFLIKNTHLLYGTLAFFLTAVITNLTMGGFRLSFTEQPLAHAEHLWNFLSMLLLGLTATLSDGCPMRQFVMSGAGEGDAIVAVLGMTFATVIGEFLNVPSPTTGKLGESMGYVTDSGKVFVIAGLIITLAIAFLYSPRLRWKKEE